MGQEGAVGGAKEDRGVNPSSTSIYIKLCFMLGIDSDTATERRGYIPQNVGPQLVGAPRFIINGIA